LTAVAVDRRKKFIHKRVGSWFAWWSRGFCRPFTKRCTNWTPTRISYWSCLQVGYFVDAFQN